MRSLAFALALLVASPAPAARRHRKSAPALRAEDDPRKRGAHRAFARAKVRFISPKDRSEVEPGEVHLELEVKGYALGALKPGGPVPHAHLIVDNEPALQLDAAGAYVLRGLPEGPHLVRAVLCRPWHEVVKARGAFALARFWVGAPPAGKERRSAEAAAWPDPRKPLLTYVLPIGIRPRIGLPVELAPAAPIAPVATSSAATDPPAAHLEAPEAPVLDFYISGTKLARRAAKVLVVIDRRDLPLVTDWRPHRLRHARAGRLHRLTIDLIDRRGMQARNALNRTDRAFIAK